ncbi:MAG: hypothetical protein WCG80_12040 [Spirochaetales bacterium]
MEHGESANERGIEAISQTYSLDRDLVRRLDEEFRALSAETVEQFVVRRHQELQRAGWSNEAIYEQLQRETRGGRFRARELSVRQVRRLIYG